MIDTTTFFLALWLAATTAAEPAPAPSVVRREITQDQGAWRVAWVVRCPGAPINIDAEHAVAVKVEGWVSNSRVAAHATPRWSSLVVSGLTGTSEVLTSADESQRCRERAVVQALRGSCVGRYVVLLRLEHAHAVYGDYDPLLGVRDVEIRIGPAVVRDTLPLDREQYVPRPRHDGGWSTIPEDRRDTGLYLSAPDSLHLEAHVPGNQYYRFPERPVRYATKMRLRFWYFIAAGTEGDCRARVAQYKDTPTAWKVLHEGGHEECLNVVGRWVKVERVFRTEADATTLALDFRISSPCEVGEMWVDDVTLEPKGEPITQGP